MQVLTKIAKMLKFRARSLGKFLKRATINLFKVLVSAVDATMMARLFEFSISASM